MQLKSITCGTLLLLLTGCISQYSITEQELEGYLSNEMHYEISQGGRAVGIKLQINNIDVTLGAQPNTMSVMASTRIKIRNPLVPINADLTVEFSAKPWYDVNKHSVYLRDLDLVQLSSKPKGIEKVLSKVTPQLLDYLTQFLETQPVYVLDTHNANQALIAEMTQRIEIKPGKIVLFFKK